jgi:hypothetical protein
MFALLLALVPLVGIHAAAYPSNGSTLVLYSGPAIGCSGSKANIYHHNFLMFLTYGLPCDFPDLDLDVILSLTNETYGLYNDSISSSCKMQGSLSVALRPNKCRDLGAVHGMLPFADVARYSYFVFLNCGLAGPFLLKNAGMYWTQYFTNQIQGKVKLTGLSVNCNGALGTKSPHVQSMLFATDTIGLPIIAKDAIYDCGTQLETKSGKEKLVIR